MREHPILNMVYVIMHAYYIEQLVRVKAFVCAFLAGTETYQNI